MDGIFGEKFLTFCIKCAIFILSKTSVFGHKIIQKITREITRSFTWEPGYIGAARIANRSAKELAASRINP